MSEGTPIDQASVEQLEAAIEEMKKQNQTLVNLFAQSQNELMTLKSKIKTVKRDRDMQRESISQINSKIDVAKQILEQKKRSLPQGNVQSNQPGEMQLLEEEKARPLAAVPDMPGKNHKK